jgi:hypothetical protein
MSPRAARWALVDMVGKRCGCVVVLRRSPTIAGNARWRVLCDCGNEYTATGIELRHSPPRWCQECKARRQLAEAVQKVAAARERAG